MCGALVVGHVLDEAGQGRHGLDARRRAVREPQLLQHLVLSC